MASPLLLKSAPLWVSRSGDTSSGSSPPATVRQAALVERLRAAEDGCQSLVELAALCTVETNRTDDLELLAVSDEAAKVKYPNGWKAPKPYLRIVPQPKG